MKIKPKVEDMYNYGAMNPLLLMLIPKTSQLGS